MTKRIIAVCIIGAAISGVVLFNGCGKKSNPVSSLEQSQVLGTWTGVDSFPNAGALTDSLILTLNLDSGSVLYLKQLRIGHGSSGRTLDSAETFGTWAISGSSVVLDCTHSDYYSFADNAQDSISCTLAKFPMTIPYALTGNVWSATFYYTVTGVDHTFAMTRK
jgi:hypothetical protein